MAVFYFSEGCACRADHDQPLCAHHAFKATPIGTMELIADLTIDHEFSAVWRQRLC